MKAKREYS